ncbi:hypothetical protein IKN40_01130 [bacterium]|nr:hypothetical protein [bacterium]
MSATQTKAKRANTIDRTKVRVSHLIHVDSIPEDAIPIKQYGSHSFTNLFYSPHSKSLYQQYKKRIREIPSGNDEHGKARRIYVRTSDGKTIYISMKKIEKLISNTTTSKDDPIEITKAGDNIVGDVADSADDAPGKDTTKIEYVKGKNTKSQINEIADAKAALAAATTTKGRRGRKPKVTTADIKM